MLERLNGSLIHVHSTITEMKINNKLTLMIPFHSTLYQYYIHSQLDMQAVYAASLKIEGIFFQDLLIKIDVIFNDNR